MVLDPDITLELVGVDISVQSTTAEILVLDWLITNHVTRITSSDWLFTIIVTTTSHDHHGLYQILKLRYYCLLGVDILVLLRNSQRSFGVLCTPAREG